ncbi:MAG: thioredoxin domain-containing protein, partial [Bacteroidota bacterium]
KFYTYTNQEIRSLADDHYELIADYYRITKTGNWENGVNILHYRQSDEEFIAKHDISLQDWQAIKSTFAQSCMALRAERLRPGLDDKIISGWNGLMLSGLVNAANALEGNSILENAIANAHFIKDKMIIDGKLYRSYKDGKATIPAFLEDHALVAEGMVNLYEATFDEQWLFIAQALVETVMKEFLDPEDNLFYYTSDQGEQLISRKKEVFDNVIPASNSVMANVLLRLGTLLDKNEYVEQAHAMVNTLSKWIAQESRDMSNWALVYASLTKPLAEIAIVGQEANDYGSQLSSRYMPQCILTGTTTESQLPLLVDRQAINSDTTIFVCFEKACRLPVHTVNEALLQLNS